MAVNINEGGFLYVTDGSNTMQVPFARARVSIEDKIFRERFSGDSGVKFSTGTIEREVKIDNVYFSSHDNAKNFVKQILDWNQAGSFTLKLYRNSTPNEAYLFGDGNASLTVLCEEMSDIEKYARGNQQKFKIARMSFVD